LPLREGKKARSFAKSSGKIWYRHENSAMNTTGVDIRHSRVTDGVVFACGKGGFAPGPRGVARPIMFPAEL
jgi:hypothetical protein